MDVIGERHYIPFFNRENDKILPIARCLTPANLRNIGLKEYADFYDIIKDSEFAERLREETDNYMFLDLYVQIPDQYEDLMSTFFVMSPSGARVSVVGPYGLGLRITENFLSKNPHILIFSEGNAIVRYLDLVYYMVLKE